MTYNPNVTLAKLYECTSKKGATYFRGRLGMANIVILKSDQVSDTGQPIWYVKVQEPEERGDQRPAPRAASVANHEAPPAHAPRDWERDGGDPIPF